MTGEPAVTDVLSGGGGHPVGRLPAPARLLLVAVLVLLGVGDLQARRLEVDGLLERVRQGQATVAFADRRLAATVQYASPQLTSPTVPIAVRTDLQALVRREAAGQVPALQRRRDEAAAAPIAPWHRAAHRAREAYVLHLDARLARLEAATTDLSTLYVRQPGLDGRLQDARDALTAVAGRARTSAALGAASR